MDEKQDADQRAHAGAPAGAARHALGDQQREAERARETREGDATRPEYDEGSALGPENDDPVSEASAESFPASDPPAATSSSTSN